MKPPTKVKLMKHRKLKQRDAVAAGTPAQVQKASGSELPKNDKARSSRGTCRGLLSEGKFKALNNVKTHKRYGTIKKIVGLYIESQGPDSSIGDLCTIYAHGGGKEIPGQVVGFQDKSVIVMPFGDPEGIRPGDKVEESPAEQTFPAGEKLLGRVLNALGRAIDDKPLTGIKERIAIQPTPVNPMDRELICCSMPTGVRAIDGAITIGCGQKIGIMAGSGVGKSTLLGMIAKYAEADVNVVALIGERGREVPEFIHNVLGEEGLRKSVIITATSDEAALLRIRAAYAATAIAEYFCRKNKDVILIMDSVTRVAMAQREIGLAVGEPPSGKGYTPSVYAMMPRLLERCGNFKNQGSITGIYTVLVENDDMNDTLGDALRAILDGHIVLTRSLAERNHYPPIDVNASVSRVMKDVVCAEHVSLSNNMKRILARYSEAEDLIRVGAYAAGSDPEIDEAIKKIKPINDFLKQKDNESVSFNDALQELKKVI